MLSTWTYPEDSPLSTCSSATGAKHRRSKAFTAYNVMKRRILFPSCGTQFLICGLGRAVPQNGTSPAALNSVNSYN